MKEIAFITLGCKLNYAETSTYERALQTAGFTAVPWTEGAQYFLVNTCSVTEHSDKKCRNIIRKLNRQCPEAGIFVTGCYAELKREEIIALPGVKAVFGAREKSEVVPSIIAYASETEGARPDTSATAVDSCPGTERGEFFGAYSAGERTRSFLKVQDGCDFRCNYCTVPLARGGSRNEPISEIVRKAREIAAGGVREIVLTGVNTGDFGKTTGETFFGLIKALYDVEGIDRYRISSIEPNLLTEEMVDWIAGGDKFLPHFHIPLQSGCDSVLKEMGRRYTTEDFARKTDYIRNAFGRSGRYDLEVFFGIDVIVGFPGESEEMFEQTYRFLRDRIQPAFIHIFPYSRRAGTVAAARKDQVQDSIKTERVARLEELCAQLHSEFEERHRGRHCRVLFESREKGGMMCGYSENYLRVTAPYTEGMIGQIADAVI